MANKTRRNRKKNTSSQRANMAATNATPPNSTREQRSSNKQLSTAAIEFVKRQIDILKPWELSRTQRLTTYQQMLNDDAVATCFSARSMAVSKAQAKGKFKYDVNSEESLRIKEFLEYNMENLFGQTPLTVGMCSAAMIRDGWSPFEMVFEKGDAEWGDKHKLKKLAYIHPLTLDKITPWATTPNGDRITSLNQSQSAFEGVNGVRSIGFNGFKGNSGVQTIPFNRVAYCSYSSTPTQPAGISVFDSAYIPWKEKQLLQDLTLIGVQKDMAGMPVLGAPSSLLAAASDNPSGPEARMVEQLKDNLANLHAGDQSYCVLPTDTHADNGSGAAQFKLQFLGIEGSGKNFDIMELVEQRKRAIYNCFACQNMLSGENGGGSYNLLEGQSSIQAHFVELDTMIIDDMWNKQIFPKLMKLNNWDYKASDMPKWKAGNVQKISADEAGKLVSRTKSILPAHPDVVNYVLDMMDVDYRVPINTPVEVLREMLFDIQDNQGEDNGGTSGSGGNSQDNSDVNNENAA